MGFVLLQRPPSIQSNPPVGKPLNPVDKAFLVPFGAVIPAWQVLLLQRWLQRGLRTVQLLRQKTAKAHTTPKKALEIGRHLVVFGGSFRGGATRRALRAISFGW